MLFRLAWRNIWRNKRRTFITIASILFAVLLSSLMESIQKGAWNNMINNVVNFYTGYIQIHQKGYWEDQALDKAIPFDERLASIPSSVPLVRDVLPRLESFALASTGNNTMGVLVSGVNPSAEAAMTGLRERLIAGEYLSSGDEAVMIGAGIADNLNLKVGDTLLLISQGYHGVNAAGKYPVKSIVRFPSPDLNKMMVYLPLAQAQWFYGAEGMVTSVTVRVDRQDDIQPVVQALSKQLDPEAFEVMDWQQLLPDLLEAKKLDSAGNVIVYIILYMIIAFGIFGTVLMMTLERRYEFGILVAIGMKRGLLAALVWVEILMMGIIGALAGIVACMPVTLYFKYFPLRFSGGYEEMLEKWGFEPIFPAEFSIQIFLTQAIVIFIITTIIGLVPVRKIKKLKPVEAMRA